MARHSVRASIALAASPMLLAGTLAWAEEPAAPKKSVTEQVLEILREQGTIDAQRYDALKQQLEQEERERQGQRPPQAQTPPPAPPPPTIAAATLAAPATPDPEGWKIAYKDYGVRLERNDGLYKFHVGGLIQFDVAGIDEDDALKNLGIHNEGTGEEFRRARLMAEGELGENLMFRAEYDFAGGSPQFKDVWIGMQRLPYVGRALVGHFKEPQSLDELTSDRFITFMERALPVLAFSTDRNSGVAIQNTGFDQRMTWGVGGFRASDNFGNGFSESSPYNVTARITGLPVYEDDGATLVHVGYSYSHRFRGADAVEFNPRPEVHLSNPIIDTGNLSTDGVDVFGAELATVTGPVSFQGEFLDSLVDVRHSDEANLWGAYGQASWFLTGEHRAYDRTLGAFGRTSPKNPFSISKEQWGAWELAARYSYVDLNDESVRGGIESDVTGAVNWYLYGNFRIMLDYVWAHRNDVGDQNTLMTRFGIDF
ncbi:MAG TPA: porin [Myxococcota bacterium]|nr:porin [Myxococcota bacterium]